MGIDDWVEVTLRVGRGMSVEDGLRVVIVVNIGLGGESSWGVELGDRRPAAGSNCVVLWSRTVWVPAPPSPRLQTLSNSP